MGRSPDEVGTGVRGDDVVAWLDEHTNYESAMPTRLGAPTLDRITELCRLLGDPERACPVVHITGTNGKGSTARILTELLMANGLTVGTYTSPNLETVNERLARDGTPIDDDELAEVLGSLALIEPMMAERPTRFELLTAAAFRWFADVAVDVAVVEVGLGGRWDATNVVRPDVAVVTNVSYDHVEVLGPTLRDIAVEKSGIIKPGCRVLVGEMDPGLRAVFTDAADAVGAAGTWVQGEDFACEGSRVAVGGRLIDLRTPSAEYPEVYLPLHGAHQAENAAIALGAAEAFFGSALAPEVVEHACASVTMPCRMEVVGRAPLVILDGAHNVAGAQALARGLIEELPTGGETVVVIGMLEGRDPSAMVEALIPTGVTTVVACTAPSPRAMPGTAIADAARAAGLVGDVVGSTADALALARRRVSADGRLVVTGSLYVVAEARPLLVPSASQRQVSDSLNDAFPAGGG
ncbi:MAG TPA: Mur ligase family protein [Acidimicrobiales bacterium]|nr:Mur ligase family protein [Acidimicrobiales bacterium]